MTYILSEFSSLMGFLAADGQRGMFRCIMEGGTCLERKGRGGGYSTRRRFLGLGLWGGETAL